MSLNVEKSESAEAALPASEPSPAVEWMVRFFEQHPLIGLCLVILFFPVALAVGTVVGAKWLLDNGRKNAAIAVIAVGSIAAIGGAAWWIANSGSDRNEEHPAPVVREQFEPSGRAWLSPDGTGGNCAWFPGVASDYADPFTFCDYPAP